MNSNTSKRASIVIGGFMIFVLILGAVVPLFQNQLAVPVDQPPPTPIPTATFPPPISNLDTVSFDELYLHPTGLYAVAQPTGWEPSGPVIEPNRAAITMINNPQLSVIEVSVERSEPAISTLDELDARFTDAYLEGSWSRYGSWEETARRVENDKLLLDFNLQLNRQTYIARQLSWTDGDWIYNARVVAPSNAPEMLVGLVNRIAETIRPFKQFAGTPFQWTAFYDNVNDHIIRYPQDWTITDTGIGSPTSISGANGVALRVDTERGAEIADEEAAQAWVTAARPSATVLSVEPVERGDAAGFSVAYSFRTADGEPFSGLAVLLNGADGALHTANLAFPGDTVDLNNLAPVVESTPEATQEFVVVPEVQGNEVYAEVMNTFVLLPQLPLAGTVEVTPTPLPEPVEGDVIEVTEAPAEPEADATEAAVEADTEAEADATEAAAEPEAEATEADE